MRLLLLPHYAPLTYNSAMMSVEHNHNPLLFGYDQRTGIVAVEPAGQFVRLFIRSGSSVTFHDEKFNPFILLSGPELLGGCPLPYGIRHLSGPHYYTCLAEFETWADCLATRDFLLKKTGKGAHAADAPYLFISDFTHQYLLATGTTLFKDLVFSELRCLALHMTTACGSGFERSHPGRPEDRISAITLACSHGPDMYLGDDLSEVELLLALNRHIRHYDPDVITGHGIYRCDLDYIGFRAKLLGVRLDWGRNGASPRIVPRARWILGDKAIEYPRWELYGRHVIDTWMLAQLYDAPYRTLDNYGLQEVAGLVVGDAGGPGCSLEGINLSSADPDTVGAANTILALFRFLAYPWFLHTRMVPYSFQNCPLRGAGTRINSLILREYLRQGYSLPARSPAMEPFSGGFTRLFQPGVHRPVVHCDVASLYPSLMLTYCLAPVSDSLKVFLRLLAQLHTIRLAVRDEVRQTDDSESRRDLDAMERLCTSLVNSFFGYLGAPHHLFADSAAAAEVTRLGRVTMKHLLEALDQEGAMVIEADTDGIYFCPPESCRTNADERALIQRISGQLPQGVSVELDGRYRAMVAYKAKNYALLTSDGTVRMRGSVLNSRAVERYLRCFLREAVTLILNGEGQQVAHLYEWYSDNIRNHTFDISLLARTETLTETALRQEDLPEAKQAHRSAGAAIASAADRVYRPGDTVLYYITGTTKEVAAFNHCRPVAAYNRKRPDINVPYYLEKLRQAYVRLAPFLPEEPTLFDL